MVLVVALVTRHFGGGAEGWDAVIERTGALPAGWPSDVMAGAQLLVFRTFDNIAYGLVVNASAPISVNDIVTNP